MIWTKTDEATASSASVVATAMRRGAVQAIQQAKRMLTRSTRSMRAVEKGDSVAVPVPTFDRSKGDPTKYYRSGYGS